MLKYKHIVLAMDFSEKTSAIIVKAIEIAKMFKAELSLLHVISPIELNYKLQTEELEKNVTGIEATNMAWAKKHLENIGKKYSIPKKNQLIYSGKAKNDIINIAKKFKADLIVVGSHGQGGFVENLLGSTANAVVNKAKCDVLVIRTKQK